MKRVSTSDLKFAPAAPTTDVVSVSSSTSDGTYGVGQTISIDITFESNVLVTGVPLLSLATPGPGGATASYLSGSGSKVLTFKYVVASGQTAADLDYSSASALSLNGGTIIDTADHEAALTLPSPGSAGSLGANKNIVIDTTGPIVTNVTSTNNNATYRIGQTISIQVTFNETVVLTGVPQLTLETGASDAIVDYSAGSGTNNLTFTYTVTSGHSASDLDYKNTTSLALNGGTIKDAYDNPADLTLASPGAAKSLGANKNLVIDGIPPSVSNVSSSSANGTYLFGQTVGVRIVFDEIVTVTGTPRLTLETGASDAIVNYASGSGTTTLLFNYTVANGEESADLDYLSSTSLALNSGTIIDRAGNAAVLTLPAPGATGSLGANHAIVIDGLAPRVTNVTSTTSDGTYRVGRSIPIQVTFDKAVVVTGAPRLTLETGLTDRFATYSSGSGGNTLTFTYNVQDGDLSNDLDYASSGSLALNGGTIRDNPGNPALLPLPTPGAAGSLGANKAIVIDGVTVTLASVNSSTPNGHYGAAQTVSIQVIFSGAVTVTGTPTLALNTAPVAATASYVSGTGSNTLSFNYVIGGNEESSDLDVINSSGLSLNGGTIQDSTGQDAILTVPTGLETGSLASNKEIHTDGIPPRVANVNSSTSNGTYGIGSIIDIQVTFDEKVKVIGTPQLMLKTAGFTNANVDYTSGSTTDVLIFRYTVGNGQETSDLNYLDLTSLSLNLGRIDDIAGNPGILTLPALAGPDSLGTRKAIVIDGMKPYVTSVNSTVANGTYAVGQTLPIQIGFSETVTVTGTPTLTLETGVNNESINYVSGSGSNTLTFSYTVRVGNSSADLDYVSRESLSFAGGSIHDAINNPATLELPLPGAAGSLGNNKNLIIVPLQAIYTHAGTEDNGYQGFSVAAVNDVNRDGANDYIIGEPQASAGGTSRGAVRIYSGKDGSVLKTIQGTEDNAQFGYAVAGLGDVNGDGKSDFIVGEPFAAGDGTERGKYHVYLGGNAPELFTELFSGTGSNDGARLGFSVAASGDVDRDGKFDFLVGEPGAPSGGTNRGAAHLYSGATGGVIFNFSLVENNASFGYSVAGPGDINGDGSPDLAIGEPFAAASGTKRGSVHLYSGTDGAVITSIHGAEDNAQFGYSLSAANEIDRDGNGDFLVGEPFAAAEGTARGKVYAYTGASLKYTISGNENSAQFGRSVAWGGDINRDGRDDFLIGQPLAAGGGVARGKMYAYSGDNGELLYTMVGTEDGDSYGYAVAGLGDINGDGRGDFIVGSHTIASGGSARGAAFVYASGFTKLPSGNLALAATITGTEDSAFLGYQVASAGDVNGDSRGDYIVGEPQAAGVDGGVKRGKAYVFSGSGGGLIHTLIGSQDNGEFGKSVAGLGDVNGDGKGDFIIGEPYSYTAGPGRGTIHVFSGADGTTELFTLYGGEDNALFGSAVAGTGDVNGDGKPDFIVGAYQASGGGTKRGSATVFSGADGSVLFNYDGPEDNDFFGYAVAGAGDVSGDGKMDFIIGAYQASGSGVFQGIAKVYSGANGSVLYSLSGSEDNAQFGKALAGAGDVNADGKADFIIGEPAANAGGLNRGKARVFSGADGSVLYVITGSENLAVLGSAVSGAGDVNGDGKADFIVGEYGADAGGVDRGMAYIYSGASGNVLFTITGSENNALLGNSVAPIGDGNADGYDDFVIGEYDAAAGGMLRGKAYHYTAPAQ